MRIAICPLGARQKIEAEFAPDPFEPLLQITFSSKRLTGGIQQSAFDGAPIHDGMQAIHTRTEYRPGTVELQGHLILRFAHDTIFDHAHADKYRERAEHNDQRSERLKKFSLQHGDSLLDSVMNASFSSNATMSICSQRPRMAVSAEQAKVQEPGYTSQQHETGNLLRAFRGHSNDAEWNGFFRNDPYQIL